MGSRILLADDSITIQKVVNLTFADEGIEVVAVSNGDIAERRLNEVQPDLVLADIFMPGKNGYELCEAIKQNPQFRHVPVVLLVGAFEPFDQAEARRVQADAHLTKPFESRTLVETVRRLISASGHATTGPIAPLPSPGEGRDDNPRTDPLPPHVLAAAAPKLDLSEMMADQPLPASSSSRKTGELSSMLADAPPPVFDIAAGDMLGEEAGANFGGANEKFDPMELASIGDLPDAVMEPSIHDQPDVILDFDKVEPLETSAPLRAVSFDPEASFEVENGGSIGAAEWSSKDDLDGNVIEVPTTNNAWQAGATAPLNGQAAAFRMQSESAFAHSDGATETAVATMLAVEDPLGDVLFDESVSSAVSTPFGHDLLDIELTEPAAVQAPDATDTHFDLVETTEEPSASPQASAVEDRNEDVLALNDSDNGAAMHADQAQTEATEVPSDPQADFVESDDILDWTSNNEGGQPAVQLDSETVSFDISESQPDSVMMTVDDQESPLDSVIMPVDESQTDSVVIPMDAAESQNEDSDEKGVQEADNKHEATFESARTWTEEEARFTAIDTEAFPVEESEPSAQFGEAADTGFAFSPVEPEQPGHRAEASAAAVTHSDQRTNGAAPPSDLSPATIEEIVRRVVAAMSESVVREVAWEVVPDCVERVIDQLTRESLSRRA